MVWKRLFDMWVGIYLQNMGDHDGGDWRCWLDDVVCYTGVISVHCYQNYCLPPQNLDYCGK